MPSHWTTPSRSAGNFQCNPSAAKMGAVYKKTTMCEALVWRSPSPTSKNSSPNNNPTTTPGRQVPSLRRIRSPRIAIISPTSTAATPERRPIWNTGAMSAAVALSTTCCRPHTMHNTSISAMACPSSDLRVVIQVSLGWLAEAGLSD
jgi:hypothetical protein